jgi:hypothetical protein
MTTKTTAQRPPTRLLALIVLPLVLLTGCAEEAPVTTTPSAVLEQERTSKFGSTEEVQRILNEAKALAETGFAEQGTLALNSDYFNVRNGEITFTETWPGSWGVMRFHLVTLWPTEDRLVMSSKDSTAVCWYIDMTRSGNDISVRYGASIDAACRSNDADNSDAVWQEDGFPTGPVVGQTPAADNSGGSSQTNSTNSTSASPAASPVATPTR